MGKFKCYIGPIMPNLPSKQVSKGGGGKAFYDLPENPGWGREGVLGPTRVDVLKLQIYILKKIFFQHTEPIKP